MVVVSKEKEGYWQLKKNIALRIYFDQVDCCSHKYIVLTSRLVQSMMVTVEDLIDELSRFWCG